MKIHLADTGLPVHPFTRMTAIGFRRNGAPIWPVRGGSGEGDDTGGQDDGGVADGGGQDDGGTDDDSGSDADLGDAGKKALAAMKADRNKARQELKKVNDQLTKLAPLQKLAEALGAKPEDGPTDVDALTQRVAKFEQDLVDANQARWRAEVAAEKGLTAAQAKRLIGTSREDLAKDADALLADFGNGGGQQNGNGRGGLRPDPSQGNRGGKPASGRDAALAEAQKRFGKKPAVT